MALSLPDTGENSVVVVLLVVWLVLVVEVVELRVLFGIVVKNCFIDKPRAWLFLKISTSSKSLSALFRIEFISSFMWGLEIGDGGLKLSKVFKKVSDTLLMFTVNKNILEREIKHSIS